MLGGLVVQKKSFRFQVYVYMCFIPFKFGLDQPFLDEFHWNQCACQLSGAERLPFRRGGTSQLTRQVKRPPHILRIYD